MKEEKFVIGEVQRQVGDFNILKFPLEFWEMLETFAAEDKIKITLEKVD